MPIREQVDPLRGPTSASSGTPGQKWQPDSFEPVAERPSGWLGHFFRNPVPRACDWSGDRQPHQQATIIELGCRSRAVCRPLPQAFSSADEEAACDRPPYAGQRLARVWSLQALASAAVRWRPRFAARPSPWSERADRLSAITGRPVVHKANSAPASTNEMSGRMRFPPTRMLTGGYNQGRRAHSAVAFRAPPHEESFSLFRRCLARIDRLLISVMMAGCLGQAVFGQILRVSVRSNGLRFVIGGRCAGISRQARSAYYSA